MSTEAPRRGRPPTLSRASIVDVARAQLDDAGIENFSMRSLAAEIGVTPMSIYRHVGDREQLLGLLLDEVSAPFPNIELPADPRVRITALLSAAFDVLVSKRWIAEVLRAGSPGGAGALWLVDQILCAAEELGLSAADALVMYRALWSYTLGSVLSTGTATNEPTAAAATEQKLNELGPDRFAHLSAALEAAETPEHRAAYLRGIGYLVDGYTHRNTGHLGLSS